MTPSERFRTCGVCKKLIDFAHMSATSWDQVNWYHVPCARDINRPRLAEMMLSVADAIAICDRRLETGPDLVNMMKAEDRRLLIAVRAHLQFRMGELVAEYHYNSQLPDWWEK